MLNQQSSLQQFNTILCKDTETSQYLIDILLIVLLYSNFDRTAMFFTIPYHSTGQIVSYLVEWDQRSKSSHISKLKDKKYLKYFMRFLFDTLSKIIIIIKNHIMQMEISFNFNKAARRHSSSNFQMRQMRKSLDLFLFYQLLLLSFEKILSYLCMWQ